MTGGERYMLTIASCLSDEHEVSLFWDDPQILEKARERFGLQLDKVSVRKNIFSTDNTLMRRLSKSYEYDVIIYLSDGSIPILAAKKTILHFQFPVEWVDSDRMLSRLKLKNVRRIICNSQFTKSFIDRKFAVESHVIYPPVQKIPTEERKKEKLILTVGRFSLLPNGTDYKKQVMLIESFKKMVDSGIKDWKLAIVTSSFSGGQNGIDLLQEHGAGYPVEVHANISKDALDDLYGTAAIYWHAAGFGEDLHAHPDWAEHFGIATVEAMSAGCVPVVINAGGQKEIVTDGEDGYLWATEDELLRKTKKLIGEQSILEALRSDPQAIDKKYGIARFCREFHKTVV
jgi:glycosyltransferase involved in cell wall biosynthesis